MFQNLRNVLKVSIRRNSILLYIFINKNYRMNINEFSAQPKNLKHKQQSKPKESKRKEITKE